MYRPPRHPNSSLRLLKLSPKLQPCARTMLDLAARQPGKALTVEEVARQAGVSLKQGIEGVRTLHQESERLGVASFFGWDTDRRTGEISFAMNPETAAMWSRV